MFPISLIRHQDPELFFAIVAPVGANVSGVCDGLVEVLKVFDYRVEPIRVIEQLKQFDTYLRKEPVSEYAKSKMRMDAGDNFREKMVRDDALALLSLSAVVRFRNSHPSPEHGRTVPRQAYVFRSLKTTRGSYSSPKDIWFQSNHHRRSFAPRAESRRHR
jgi:hypothetical protein